MFEQYVDAGLALVRSRSCQEVISTVDINLVMSLTSLLQVGQALPRFIEIACSFVSPLLVVAIHMAFGATGCL